MMHEAGESIMQCEQFKEQLPDYLLENLPEAALAQMQSHMALCPVCKEEVDGFCAVWNKLGLIPEEHPSPALRKQFYATLEAYQQGMTEAARTPYRRAGFTDLLRGRWLGQLSFQSGLAMVFLVMGLIVGHLLTASRPGKGEIAQLREELRGMGQLMTLALLEQQSATERLKGVNWSFRLERPDSEVLSALFRTLDSDPNVNVRLAAVEALGQFSNRTTVKQGLIQSLTRQKSPLVQISLIDLMVALQERRSLQILRQLTNNEKLNQAVRQRAEWGLKQLS
jgi:HEAT repeat protein/putative zinc finger protein